MIKRHKEIKDRNNPPMLRKPFIERFFKEEDGLSTVGVLIALLLTLSLIFTAAQVYQVNSASATVQNVADAAALAAENPVAEFYILVKLCDALVLSLSLTSVVVLGLGVVALCVPAGAPVGKVLIDAGKKIVKTRNTFSEKAADGLNRIQKYLPFLSAASAEAVIVANNGGPMNASYVGAAILIPYEGEKIIVGSFEGMDSLLEDIENNEQELEEAAQAAEEAAKTAREEKTRAFEHDCGLNPDYCMYERAGHLASLPAHENPLYHSVDTWSFSVALKRAQAYYPLRQTLESGQGATVGEQANSALRKRFYEYASEEVSKGYVREDESGFFEALFPLLPKNTSEMKQTSLYEEVVYPITGQGDTRAMHAWSGCPSVVSLGSAGLGSLAQLDSGGFQTCTRCEFTVSSFGKIAAASSSIENGFEYHYRIVAESAAAYEKAQKEYLPHAEKVRSLAGGIFDQVGTLLSQSLSYRIKSSPPGRFGAVALVANIQTASPSQKMSSSFVTNDASLGMQAALSAATLVSDAPEEGANVIASLLDNVKTESGESSLPFAEGVLEVWSSFLLAYTRGQESLEEGIEKGLNELPLVSESGLGTWAAKKLKGIIETFGFEPVELDSPKPVLVNSAHVLAADTSGFSENLLSIKKSFVSAGGSGSFFSSSLSQLEKAAFEGLDSFPDKITIASIELFGEQGPSIPLTIALPPQIKAKGSDFLQGIFEQLYALEVSLTGVREWS